MSNTIARREPPAWAHQISRFLPVVPAILAAATAVTSTWRNLGSPGIIQIIHCASGQSSPPWQTAAVIVVLVIFFTSFYIATWHSRQLCPRCALLTPLDPQNAVTRWHSALRLCHWGYIWRGTAIFLAGYFACLLFLPNGWPLSGVFTGFWLLVAAWDFAQWKHSLLQPWCPWCHFGGGDGDEEVSPAPEPSLEQK